MNKEETRKLVADFFARTGRLITNGVPLISAFEVIAAEVDDQPVFKKILTSICQSLEVGKTELEIVLKAEAAMKLAGARDLSFPTVLGEKIIILADLIR